MGEIADDLIEGRACQWCGEYFQDPENDSLVYEHGYPVLCEDCFDTAKPKERQGLQRAIVKTI